MVFPTSMPFVEGQSLDHTTHSPPSSNNPSVLRDVARALALRMRGDRPPRHQARQRRCRLPQPWSRTSEYERSPSPRATDEDSGDLKLTVVNDDQHAHTWRPSRLRRSVIDHRADIYAFGCMAYECSPANRRSGRFSAANARGAHQSPRLIAHSSRSAAAIGRHDQRSPRIRRIGRRPRRTS